MYAAREHRPGFTLIEIMVVVLIIAILVGLTTAVVMKLGNVGTDAQATNEIRQLALAVENFKQKYGVYPPSRFTVPPESDTFSSNYARVIWPRIVFANNTNWGGAGTLTGDQCLVYFLRGPAGDGWSPQPAQPTKPKSLTTETRVGPFFTFPEDRLYPASGFRSFKDAYATPGKWKFYVYFSSYRQANGYQPALDSVSGVSPYSVWGSSPVRYYNPNSFQIISAGANYQFGPGGAWQPGVTAGYDSEAANGFDDLSNFHPNKLGVP